MAAVELALVAPILVLLGIGIADLGMAFYGEMRVEEAVQAGAHYANRTGRRVTKEQIVNVIRATSTLSSEIQDDGTIYDGTKCYCMPDDWSEASKAFVSVTQMVSDNAVDCTATCPSSGEKAGRFTVIKVKYVYKPMFTMSAWLAGGTDGGVTMSKVEVARVDG